MSTLQTQLSGEIDRAAALFIAISDDGLATALPLFDPVLEFVRQAELPVIQAEVRRILQQATAIDAQLAALLNGQNSGGLDAINLGGFSTGAPSAEEARALAAALTDGDITAEDLELLHSQMQRAGVTTDQLPQGAAFGDEVVLPAGSLDYLQELYGNISPDKWLELQASLQNGSQDHTLGLSELHNGWLAVSSEKFSDAGGAVGGVDRLPTFAQQMLTGDPISDKNGVPPELLANPVWDKAINDPNSIERLALNNAYFGQINGFPQPGGALTKDLLRVQSAGSDLSTGIVRNQDRADQFNQMITTLTGADVPYGETDGLRVSSENVGVDIQKLVHKNPQAIAEMLAGDPGEVREIFGPLIKQEWADDGHAMGETFSWMGDGMLGDNPNLQVSPEDSSRAAFGLATLLTDNGFTDELLDAGGENGSESVGQLNPRMMRGVLEGLTPAIPNMLGHGEPNEIWFDQNEKGLWVSAFDTDEAGEASEVEEVSESLQRVGNLSILMHTDPETAASFRSHLDAMQDGQMRDGISGSSNAADLNAILAFGEDAVEIENGNDAGQLTQQEFDSEKTRIELGEAVAGEVIGKLPPGLDFAGGQALEYGADALIGEDPEWVDQALSGGSRPLSFEELGDLNTFKQSIRETPLTPEEVQGFVPPEAMRPDGSIDFEKADITETKFRNMIKAVLDQRGQTSLADEFSDRSGATYDSLANTFNGSGRG